MPRVALLGLGLIGGSIARALARLPSGERPSIAAWSPSGRGPRAGLAEGVVSTVLDDAVEAWAVADLVVLAAPPLACLELLERLADARPEVGSPATLTDVASTKARIVARADQLGLPFVGGHPMAGREVAGYDASDPDLLAGRPWVVVPGTGTRPEDLERVGWLAGAAGARPVTMDADDHDRAVAAISHLPLVLSAALVESVVAAPGGSERSNWGATQRLAAGGWASMTRLALGDPEMGAGILVTNSAEVAARLRDLRAVIDDWLMELGRAGGPDPDRLRHRLTAARDHLAGSSQGPGPAGGPTDEAGR